MEQSQKEKNIPEWGKIEKSDLELKECDFDKNAEALVLFDGGELYGNDYAMIELKRHIRIKILKDKGLVHANIKIPFYSFKGDESVKKLDAQTFNIDASGNVVATKVEKKLVYEKKLNKRYSEIVFTFPEVKAGSAKIETHGAAIPFGGLATGGGGAGRPTPTMRTSVALNISAP